VRGRGELKQHEQHGDERAAEARLAAIDAQLAELMLQRCRLRRLVQVCEHGSGGDCAALHINGFPGQDDLMTEEER
jgi:hypothetical protein